MQDITHRFVTANGIQMHVAEQGDGPLVVLCHGFPELWYSWRHQLPALAEAGFHAVAPDQRGYGQTECPESVDSYTALHLAGDIVSLVHALGHSQAVIIGHDWGAAVAWTCALLRPDIFRAVALLSVPYLPRSSDFRPTDAMRSMAGDQEFYQLYFQEPGKAERDLEADVDKSMRMLLYSLSGDAPPEQRWRFLFGKAETLIDTGALPETLPEWLTEQDLEFYAAEFRRTGFRGGLNWYRNMDRTWELTGFLEGAVLRQPLLFVAGETDPVIVMYQDGLGAMEQIVPNLSARTLVAGAGHWVQQERPAEVNRLLVEFLASLGRESRSEAFGGTGGSA
jgi:pimeloyl-ACP methyl ester carboxylesterase